MLQNSGHAKNEEVLLFERFRKAYEEHEKRVWELEKVTARLLEAKRDKIRNERKEEQREIAARSVQEALVMLQALVHEARETFGSPDEFLCERVGGEGLAGLLRQKAQRDALERPDAAYPYTLRTALLEMFLEREKQSRASIYKKHVRGGFGVPVEKLIEEERAKNEAHRKKMLEKYPDLFSPADIELFNIAFRRRMARHGEDAI